MGSSEPDSEARKIIETVHSDTRSGAAQLAAKALRLVRQWLESRSVTATELDRLLKRAHRW